MNDKILKKFRLNIFEKNSFEGGGFSSVDSNDIEDSASLEDVEGADNSQDESELSEDELKAIESARIAAENEMRKLAEAGFGEKLVRVEGVEVQGREEQMEALRKAIEEVKERG